MPEAWAASWLTTGHSLLSDARQLGHRNLTTTEEHYGHLELSLLTNTLAATDDAITQAVRNHSPPVHAESQSFDDR